MAQKPPKGLILRYFGHFSAICAAPRLAQIQPQGRFYDPLVTFWRIGAAPRSGPVFEPNGARHKWPKSDQSIVKSTLGRFLSQTGRPVLAQIQPQGRFYDPLVTFWRICAAPRSAPAAAHPFRRVSPRPAPPQEFCESGALAPLCAFLSSFRVFRIENPSKNRNLDKIL